MNNADVPISYEEYIETIFRLNIKFKNQPIKTSQIAKELNIKAPSVTEMLDKLKEKDLINYEKRRGVTLTKKGKEIGEKLLTYHRIIEYFLKLFLGIQDYHDIACKLEHHFNDDMAKKLLNLMGDPTIELETDTLINMKSEESPQILNKDALIREINSAFSQISKIVKDEEKLVKINIEKENLIKKL